MEPTTLAYAAGLFDGEGHVSIRKRVHARNQRPYWAMSVSITNTDRPVLDWLQETWGGGISKSGYLRVRQPYRWILSGPTAREWLEAVGPFLRIKREQALVAVEFQAGVDGNGNRHLTDAEVDRREALRIRLLDIREAA